MILIDEPRWPAHGSLYGHMVSDTTLWELHDAARRAGLSPLAFDHDHYDLRADRVPDALAVGARQVHERELVDRLRTSGIRILPAQRAPRTHVAHHRVRERLLAMLPGQQATVDDLLARYGADERRYHDLRHLDEMLRTLDRLARAEGLPHPSDAEVLATAWHDAVYRGVPGQDERDSAALAVRQLTAAGLPRPVVAEVERLVLLTIAHAAEPGDPAGTRLCDADLAILASAPGRYHVSVRDIRVEYGALDDQRWAAGRRAVLEGFLSTERLFGSPAAREWFERSARANIADELAHLPAS
ncbi:MULTISPECIES: DUF4031 domain-containing protein [unclassified Luteococcus]|uniref:DUF4031 domain-containing protein n=1 Tax=unclassified Luteococcus TaxID=2639923 RepID=UPI00313E0080